jgi:hypothetical protein
MSEMWGRIQTAEEGPHSPGVNRDAFNKLYAAYAPVLFGIVSRIVDGAADAETALSDVFVCLHKNGLLVPGSALNLTKAIPVVFDCATKALKTKLSPEQIADRIDAERERMRARMRAKSLV